MSAIRTSIPEHRALICPNSIFPALCRYFFPGTLRDSLFLLAVVLEQQTELHPTEIMTDTGAYTDVVFGLFWLLRYRFSPRIGNIGGAQYTVHGLADN